MQKRALAVHDLSCVGRCSLTVALPILSAAGVNTAVIPTALLSTHTGEFTGYTHLDLTDQLAPITAHLSTLGLRYDAFYSGYLASPEQVGLVLEMLDKLTDQSTHVFVDPAFADQGRLYKLMDARMPGEMRDLVRRARTIVPNLTEACFLLDEPYRAEGYDAGWIGGLAQALSALGPENVVVTDVRLAEGREGVAVYRHGKMQLLTRSRFPGVFHGTGDVFASFLLAAMLAGKDLNAACELALDCTHESIRLTLEGGEPLRYGVRFEQALPIFLRGLE